MVEDGETASDSDGENGTEQLVAEQLVSIIWFADMVTEAGGQSSALLSWDAPTWICWIFVGYCWIGRTSQGCGVRNVHHSRQSHAAAPQ